MPLSLEIALRHEVFSEGRVQVFGGQDRLATVVRRVHVLARGDNLSLLGQGALLLSSEEDLASGEEQPQVIREANESGAVALIIRLRKDFLPPRALIAEAERLGFPLIGFFGPSVAEIVSALDQSIANIANSELFAFEQLNSGFIRLLLSGASHIAFVEKLAYHIGYPVVLENAAHEIISYAGGDAEADEVIRSWAAHSGSAGSRHGSVAIDAGAGAHPAASCARHIISLMGEIWGALHAMHGAAPLPAACEMALSRASEVIAIALMRERETDREGDRGSAQRQTELVSRLLVGDISGSQFVERALRVGRDLRELPLVVLAEWKSGEVDFDEEVVGGVLKRHRLPHLEAEFGGQTVIVVGLTKGVSISLLSKDLSRTRISAGISRVAAPDQLPAAIREARIAASVASKSEASTLVTFDGLGTLRLLVALDEASELQKYVDYELGRLVAYDATAGTPLLDTLRAYLAAGGNKVRAAEILFVHRRTLYYRLERISALLNRPLEDPESRTALDIALRGWDYLRDRGGGPS